MKGKGNSAALSFLLSQFSAALSSPSHPPFLFSAASCPQFASDIATSNTNARSTMKKKEATAATKKRKRNNPEINNEEERSNPAENQRCKTQQRSNDAKPSKPEKQQRSNPGGEATVRTEPNGEGFRRRQRRRRLQARAIGSD